MPASTPASRSEPETIGATWRKRLRRRSILWALAALEVLVLAYVGISVTAAESLMNPAPQPLTQTPAAFGLLYQTVSFSSRDDHLQIRGWLMPGLLPDGQRTVQRTLILVHGIPGNRSDSLVIQLSADLVRHGFAVLAIDLRGYGESARAPLSLGEFEQRDILGAVDFLRSGPLAYPLLGRTRVIGGWGLSLGGATLLLAAAQEPALRAVVTDSAFADATSVVRSRWEQQGVPSWLLPGALLAGRVLYGVDYAQARPVAVVARIAPRPILLIHGTADTSVPIANLDQLAAAAAQPANAHVQTWKVPDAGHAQAYWTAPTTYVQTVVAFYQSALGPDGG
jgi:dipeptidyl aminopeptidase/acylaminoacyl peptidase